MDKIIWEGMPTVLINDKDVWVKDEKENNGKKREDGYGTARQSNYLKILYK